MNKTWYMVRGARHVVHQHLVESRVLAPAYFRARPQVGAQLPGPATDVVIDGYPRSANTYAVAAMAHANPGVRISSHLHSWLAVRRGLELGRPVVVLIREPLAAAASLMAYHPGLPARAALRQYLAFYRPLQTVRDDVVVGVFGQVIADFGDVIERVNARFGTAFAGYRREPADEQAVRERVEQMERDYAGGTLDESRVGRPSDERRDVADRLRADLETEAAMLHDAREMFRTWT